MKKDDNIIYEFDAEAQILNIKVNGRLQGGFMGSPAEREFSRLLETGANINFTDMSDSIKKARVRRLRAIWINQGIDQFRESILEGYGVSSTADLNLEQLDELIDRYSNAPPASEHIRRQRSSVMGLLTRLGVYKDDSDWQRVNNYLMDSRIAGKLLFQMSSDELNVLDHKLRSILAKREASDIEINRQKLLN